MTALRRQTVAVPVMYLASVFLVIVDGVITTVALPSLARHFHLSPAALDSVVVVYPVCLGLMVPASAWLLERYGGRRMLLLGLALFTLASALCGTARDLPQLVAFRAAQGAAAGLLTPVSQGLLFRTFTQQEQVRLTRVLIIPQQLAPALAPVLGGVLVDTLGWRWVFLVNLPLGLAALAFGLAFLSDPRADDTRSRRLDLPGLLLSAGGLGALMYGVCAGPDLGWSAPPVLAGLLAGTALLTAAARHQWHTPQPALRVRLFEDRMFRRASVLNALALVPFLGAMFLVPLVVQQLQGRSALDSGTATCTEAVGILLTVQVVGRVYHRVGPGPLVGAGMLGVAAVELWAVGATGAGTGLWTFRLVMFLLGLAMGAVYLPLTAASLTSLERADAAQAATLSTVMRQTASALAPAVVTATLVLGTTSSRPGATPPAGAYRLAFLALGVLALVCAAYGLTLGRPDRPSRASVAGRPPASAASASRPSRPHRPRSRPARPRRPRGDRAPAGRAGSTP
ncbi:DHA2 family efflux MFS transporter permease subunit [Streptacidiphilus jiangxiensis]|uniref:Drug resistance transporter, EmrB/QacA subfamily n=1 Tax=Streptacidiphilus jiangxiensis TaxID=235985 RepID=A0A1H7VYJ2_STRJI|nr:drug resistance transporter, EmrB/QacA subfamily [Streptacidiphilus jiangxiensis]